jgi:membrane protein
VLILAVGVVPAVMSFLHMGGIVELLTRLARWPLALVFVGAGITLIYRYGPSREPAKLRWVSWGAMFSTGLWIATSVGFSYYLQHFANYNASYGALGTLIGFMIWVWISVIILIVGAELNAELEHQTLRDSTTGQALPIGSRGAFVADTIGKPADKL